MEASRGERVLRQSIIVLGCNGVATLLAGLFLVHVGRTLDPHPFADFAVVLALTYLIGLINAPIETGICKLAAMYYAARDDARMGRLLTQGLLQGLAILAAEMAVWLPLLWAAYYWLRFDGPGALLWFAAYAVVSLLLAVSRGVLRGKHRFTAFALNQVAESAVRLVSGVALLAQGGGAGGAAAGYVFGAGVSLLLTLWQLRHFFPSRGAPIQQLWRRILSTRLPVLYSYLLIISNLDILFAKHYLEETEAAVYAMASTAARLLYSLLTPAFIVLFSHVSTSHAKGRGSGRLTATFAIGLVVLLTAGFVGLRLLGDEVFRVVFDAKYEGVSPVLQALWVAASLLVLQSGIIHHLVGTDRARHAWALLLPCVLLGALLSFWHTSAWGIAVCSLVSTLAGFPILGVIATAPPVALPDRERTPN